MLEKRYESDLSRREKYRQQWETIRGLKGRERLEYLWSYYKAVLVVLLALILVIYTVSVMIRGSREHTVLSVVVVDAVQTDDDAAETLAEGLLDMLQTGGEADQVEIVLSVNSLTDEDNIAKLRVALSTVGEADLVVCGASVCEEYAAMGAFADIRELLGDSAEQAERYMTDGQIDLTKCPDSILQDYVTYEPAYLCVLSHSDRMETAADALRVLLRL